MDYTYIASQEQAKKYLEKTKGARAIAIALNDFVPTSNAGIFIQELCNKGYASLGTPSYFNGCKTLEEALQILKEEKIDLIPIIVDDLG